jgi:hypothetical protein
MCSSSALLASPPLVRPHPRRGQATSPRSRQNSYDSLELMALWRSVPLARGSPTCQARPASIGNSTIPVLPQRRARAFPSVVRVRRRVSAPAFGPEWLKPACAQHAEADRRPARFAGGVVSESTPRGTRTLAGIRTNLSCFETQVNPNRSKGVQIPSPLESERTQAARTSSRLELPQPERIQAARTLSRPEVSASERTQAELEAERTSAASNRTNSSQSKAARTRAPSSPNEPKPLDPVQMRGFLECERTQTGLMAGRRLRHPPPMQTARCSDSLDGGPADVQRAGASIAYQMLAR